MLKSTFSDLAAHDYDHVRCGWPYLVLGNFQPKHFQTICTARLLVMPWVEGRQTCVKQAPKGKPKVVTKYRILLNTGEFTLISLLWDLKN